MGGSGELEFRTFYERVHDRVTSTATRMVRDRTTGEDLAAEALARAYSHWRTVRRHPNPDAWVMTVVGNLAVDHVRRTGRDTARDAQLRLRLRDLPPPDHAALRIDLAGALAGLSARQRDVVLMRHYADMSEREVAEALGISPGAVKNHLHRATTRLRSALGLDGAAPPVLDLSTRPMPAAATEMPTPPAAPPLNASPVPAPDPESPHAVA